MFVYSFEKLEVWQDSKELLKEIYNLCSDYPGDEKYGLVSQMKRASLSIVSNLAEGSSRKSYKDQAHFYQIAYSSTVEVLSQLIVSYEMKMINEDKYRTCREQIEKITNKINALRRSSLNAYTTKRKTLKPIYSIYSMNDWFNSFKKRYLKNSGSCFS